MKMDRIILRKKVSDLPDADIYFKRLSGIDTANIPQKYGNSVEDARTLIKENTEIAMVYKCEDIASVSDNEVVLASGVKFTGDIPPRVLKHSTQVVCYVIALCGFSELKSDQFMTEYFFDAWGSAYVECAQTWLGDQIKEELQREGFSRTHLWSPGQHHFELRNQKPLFEILKPEEIGCTLTHRCMMVPIKAVSGIIGRVPQDCTDLPLPCDFCVHSRTCPASKSKLGCAAL